ncbi:MAG: phospholipase D family protein, partial [Candidatus Heimdallarchaeota archaeon]|nr:phospholipase D family protein [Candidatus Heimdallarchaeota archaeon]
MSLHYSECFNLLTELVNEAKVDLVIIAPFIKRKTFKNLLSDIDPEVNVKCVMRWRKEDVVNGVSDLSVFEVINELPKAELYINQNLHAKYYRSELKCYIGSANVTDAGLGLGLNPNRELLFEIVDLENENLDSFEEFIFENSIKIEKKLYNLFCSLYNTRAKSIMEQSPTRIWFPSSSEPEKFYRRCNEFFLNGMWNERKNIRIAVETD